MIKKMVIMSVILISITLSGCFTVPEPPIPPNGIIYRGFFVGVGDYMFYSSGFDLDAPKYNTEKLKKCFSQCKFGEDEIQFESIETLVDWDATKENILNGILSAFGEADENDVSYFYYMGHGGVKNGIPIITPSDTKLTLETSITVHELEEHLSMIPGTKVVFLESCHVGNFIDKGESNFHDMVIDIFAQNSKDLLNKDTYQILTCGKGTQMCYVHGWWSYFCEGLLESLENLNADINGDKIVDLTESCIYIEDWIREHLCSCKEQAVQQYPDNSTFPIVEY